MTMLTEETIRDLQREFDQAELAADTTTLERLIADDFQSIGPKGFVLDKTQWIGRHGYFRYITLETSDVDVRLYDTAAIVRNIQRNTATHRDDKVSVAARVSQVWVDQQGQWRLAGIQFSPLAEG
jgi:hypothetical protein